MDREIDLTERAGEIGERSGLWVSCVVCCVFMYWHWDRDCLFILHFNLRIGTPGQSLSFLAFFFLLDPSLLSLSISPPYALIPVTDQGVEERPVRLLVVDG